MKSRPLILGTLLLAVMGVAGVQVWRIANSGDAGEEVPAIAGTVKTKPSATGSPQAAEPRRSTKSAENSREEKVDPLAGSGPASNPLRLANASMARNAPPITEMELRLRAAAVEQEANHDLKHLMGLLDLTETQQDRIFDSLVRHAPGWHPAMKTVGVAVPVETSAKTTDPFASTPGAEVIPAETASTNRSGLLDAIAKELTPDQEMELATAEIERQEWWEEIIPQLLPDGGMPSIMGEVGISAAVAASPPPAADKTGEEPAVLAE